MAIKIKTDGKWKNFKYRHEVPKKILKSEFDYQDEDISDSFFEYQNSWYHIDQFMRVEPGGALEKMGWDGYAGDSYFSGVVIELSRDNEQYKVGRYISQ